MYSRKTNARAIPYPSAGLHGDMQFEAGKAPCVALPCSFNVFGIEIHTDYSADTGAGETVESVPA